MSDSVSSLRASIAANHRWASEVNRPEATAPARAAARLTLDARLCEQHDIDLDAPDGAARLTAARRAYYQRLALKSAQRRQKKAVGR